MRGITLHPLLFTSERTNHESRTNMPTTQAIPSGLAVDPKALGDLRAHAAKDPQGALKDAAREFETLFLDMMMKSMRTAAPGKSMLDSEGTRVFTGLLDHEFSRKLADQGGNRVGGRRGLRMGQRRAEQGAGAENRQKFHAISINENNMDNLH